MNEDIKVNPHYMDGSLFSILPRHWSDDLPNDPPRPDPNEILLVIRKGDYELKLTRKGYEKVNKLRFNRVLNSLFPKKSKKGSKKNGRG